MPNSRLLDVYSDCQNFQEVLEAAGHIAEQGIEAGFSEDEVLDAKFIVNYPGASYEEDFKGLPLN